MHKVRSHGERFLYNVLLYTMDDISFESNHKELAYLEMYALLILTHIHSFYRGAKWWGPAVMVLGPIYGGATYKRHDKGRVKNVCPSSAKLVVTLGIYMLGGAPCCPQRKLEEEEGTREGPMQLKWCLVLHVYMVVLHTGDISRLG